MPPLTRRRSKDYEHRETWLIYLGDVRIGMIGQRAGVPNSMGLVVRLLSRDPSRRAPQRHCRDVWRGARRLPAAWQELAATRSETDYEAWRRQRDWTAWKDRMHDLALPLSTRKPEGLACYFCGEVVTNRTLDAHIHAAHRQTAA